MKGGKKFNGVRRISSGAEGVAYLTANNKILKVMKRGVNISDEIKLHKKLNELRLPYFPKFISSGRAVSKDEINLTNNTLSSLFNNTGNYPYNYVIMEYVEGGKEFPKYLSDKIESMIPGKTRPLTNEELNTLVNHILDIMSKMTFALYVADKVFNYRHNDLNERNCLIRPNGDPVIIDFGSNEFLYNNQRSNKSGKNTLGYFTIITSKAYYKDSNMIPYINQIKQHPKIRRFFELAPFNYETPISIEKIATSLLAVKKDEGLFNYMQTFRGLGIDASQLARAGIKIKHRATRIAPPINTGIQSQIEEARQGLVADFGFPPELINEKIQLAIGAGHTDRENIMQFVINQIFGGN